MRKFNVTNEISNSLKLKDVLQMHEKPYRTDTIILGIDSKTSDNTLGKGIKTSISRDNPLKKRRLLLYIASFYNPLGLYSPFMIFRIIIFQDTWILGIKWDEILPVNLSTLWYAAVQELYDIYSLWIPRSLNVSSHIPYTIPVFWDASQLFYGATDRSSCGDTFSLAGRRHFTNWNSVPTFCRLKSNFTDSRFPRCYSRSFPEKPMDRMLRCKGERLESLENLSGSVKNASIGNLHDSKPNSPVVPDELVDKTETSSSNNLTSQLSETSDNKSSPEINNGYASWYHAEEQQQIVNMLKEVNMRHERQLKRDSVARSERPCSDDSTCSNADRTSDDEDDGITVLVSPEGDCPPPEDIVNDYLEKSVSDYFEEFQSIFTVSPEKNIINSLTKECLKESIESGEKSEVAVLNDEKESLDQDRQKNDSEKQKEDVAAGNASGIQDAENGSWCESDQRETKVLSSITGEDPFGNRDKPYMLSDTPPSASNYPEIQKSHETLNSIVEVENSTYEHSEDPKTEKAVFLNAVKSNDKSGSNWDRCPSHSDIRNIIHRLRNKNISTRLHMKPLYLNINHSGFSYRHPETVHSFPNRSRINISKSSLVDYRIKASTINDKLNLNRYDQCSSDAIREPGEAAFIKKIPCFLGRTRIPEKKEAKSDPHLLRRSRIELQGDIPATSFSDSYLPSKSKHANYRRISLEELFQSVTRNRKDISEEDFSLESKHNNLAAASDHLKKILRIGKENESRIHSPINDCKVNGVRRLDDAFVDLNLLSGRCAPEGHEWDQRPILQTPDAVEKLADAKGDQTATKNNACNPKQNYNLNSQTKYEKNYKNYKHGKFTPLSQKDASSSLPGCSTTKPVNKNKSQNLDIVIYKNHDENILPKKNSSKECADQKVTQTKSKRRKKLKNDKVKAKNDGAIVRKLAFVTSAYNDKTGRNTELKIRSDACKIHEKLDQMAPVKNLARIDDGKYRHSWKDKKRADCSKNESNRVFGRDCLPSNDIKTQFSQEASESCVKEKRHIKEKDFSSRKSNPVSHKSCTSHEVNKESANTTHQTLKKEDIRKTEDNDEVVLKAIAKEHFRVSDLSIHNIAVVRNHRAESKNVTFRDNLHSRDDLHSPTPPKRKESPRKLRQKCVSKNFISCRSFPTREHFEGQQAVKTRQNLSTNDGEAYKRVPCSGKGNDLQISNSVNSHKNSLKTGNKDLSSGMTLSRATDIKEKFVLESIYCYSKTSEVDAKSTGILETIITGVRNKDKQIYWNEENKDVTNNAEQKNITSESENKEEPDSENKAESNNCPSFDDLPSLQTFSHSTCMNICERSLYKKGNDAASNISQNIKSEEVSIKASRNNDLSKEGVIRGNQMCCLHTFNANILINLNSAQKLDNSIDKFVAEPEMQLLSNKSTSSSLSHCNESLTREKSARTKENTERKLACKATEGNFILKNKNNPVSADGDGIQASCLRSENNNAESLAVHNFISKNHSIFCQLSRYSGKNYPKNEPTFDLDKQQVNYFIDTSQPKTNVISEISASTFEHLSNVRETQSNFGSLNFRNASSELDLFKNVTSRRTVNDKQFKDSNDILRLPKTVLKTTDYFSCKIMLDVDQREEFNISNSVAWKANTSLTRDTPTVQLEADECIMRKTEEFSEKELQLLTPNEEKQFSLQVSTMQTVLSSYNSNSESVRNDRKEKNESDSDVKPAQILLLSDVVQVPKLLDADDGLAKTNDRVRTNSLLTLKNDINIENKKI
ncbi:hypothetical protein HNY73_017412 [Argiope bruennichi]|uniref:Uncharacterized protein n=1 Tax=Argiope bruennichi TaxID=94029 RepID=A0A8T0EAZ0_ARGBR|nr:hypothetical protein HNY73_017412 [Argiope bruennichi]